MPVLYNLIEIVGDSPVPITAQVWKKNFNPGERKSGQTAFLIFNIRGITHTSVSVKVNNKLIRQIAPDPSSNASYWYTQKIALDASLLRNGNNEVQIKAIGNPAEQFWVKNMVCFFHQFD
ncbi:MAG: hypothetical protein SAK29_29610 [Scytonema sp. PMC 1069.18]|nr:hypothetical protein [Scytonema sp. PMC 1069.18]MEC4887220.1 hypothetical protein [Scytonema sp. PMC 1070.18]